VRALSAPASSRGPQRRGYPTSHIECGNARFKAFHRARPTSLSNPSPSQSEITLNSPKERVRETPARPSRSYPAPGAGAPAPGPGIRKELLTVPPSVIAFSKYVLRNALKQVTPLDIAMALGYVSEEDIVMTSGYVKNGVIIEGKSVKKVIRNWKPLYDAIHRLERYGVIVRSKRGLYDVNLDMAQRLAVAVPQAIGRRDYVALRRYSRDGSTLGLPSHWAEVIAQRDYWLEALTNATQGTSPSWPAQLIYPITRLAAPSGHRVTAIDLVDRYIIPTKSLAHRSVLYCVDMGPKTVCSPTLPQLIRYLNPPCPEPYCAPVVPYPVPVAPAKVVGPLADYNGLLIPLSGLPHNARKYELGLQAFDPEYAGFHNRFNAEVRAREGLIHLTVKSKHDVTEGYLAKALDAVPVMTAYYLDKLESVLGALADFARAHTGLNTAELMSRANAILKEALYRKRKPKPAVEPVRLQIKEVRFRAKFKDLRTGEYRWDAYRLANLSYTQFMALLGELERVPHRLTYLEVTVVMSDPTGQAVRLLGAGYLFIYHNPNKDPEGAVRIEFRPYRNVTKYVSPQDLALLFYGLVTALIVPIDLAKRTLRGTARP